jgi:hypothetical protein
VCIQAPSPRCCTLKAFRLYSRCFRGQRLKDSCYLLRHATRPLRTRSRGSSASTLTLQGGPDMTTVALSFAARSASWPLSHAAQPGRCLVLHHQLLSPLSSPPMIRRSGVEAGQEFLGVALSLSSSLPDADGHPQPPIIALASRGSFHLLSLMDLVEFYPWKVCQSTITACVALLLGV